MRHDALEEEGDFGGGAEGKGSGDRDAGGHVGHEDDQADDKDGVGGGDDEDLLVAAGDTVVDVADGGEAEVIHDYSPRGTGISHGIKTT